MLIAEVLRYADLSRLTHLGQSNVNAKESTEKVHALLGSGKGLYWMEAMSLMDAVERGIVILQDCVHFFALQAPRQSSTVEHRPQFFLF